MALPLGAACFEDLRGISTVPLQRHLLCHKGVWQSAAGLNRGQPGPWQRGAYGR
jgi:hypothetical protein